VKLTPMPQVRLQVHWLVRFLPFSDRKNPRLEALRQDQEPAHCVSPRIQFLRLGLTPTGRIRAWKSSGRMPRHHFMIRARPPGVE
jgi:hypothetical protein